MENALSQNRIVLRGFSGVLGMFAQAIGETALMNAERSQQGVEIPGRRVLGRGRRAVSSPELTRRTGRRGQQPGDDQVRLVQDRVGFARACESDQP